MARVNQSVARKVRMFLLMKYINFMSKIRLKFMLPIYYIGGSESLPPPLNGEEEIELLEKLKQGDFGVKTVLIERNLRLVVYIARKFENTEVGVEDLISIGTIGLIKAINTFNPLKNIKLATYASRCIENEILMHLRRNNKTKYEVSLDEPLNTDWDGNELLLSDVLGTENDVVHRRIEDETDKNMLNTALQRIPTREKKILEMRFGLVDGVEKTQKQVGKLCNISQSYVSRLENNGMKKLHNILEEMNNLEFNGKIVKGGSSKKKRKKNKR